jgi:uncharacterized MnhB-related membrane protein
MSTAAIVEAIVGTMITPYLLIVGPNRNPN